MKRTKFIYSLVAGLMMLAFANVSNGQSLAPPQRYLTPRGVLDTVFDGQGKRYALNDIVVKTPEITPYLNKLGIGANAPLVANSGCNSGYFNLYIQSGSGFDVDPVAMATLCQVCQDISNFIQPQLLNGAAPTVNIWVANPAFLNVSPSALGVAWTVTSIPTVANATGGVGIFDTEMWKTINSGVDSYTNTTLPLIGHQSQAPVTFYHGIIAFNLSHDWQKDMTQVPAANQHDLYTTILHEMLHSLGFVSMIALDGTSKFAHTSTGSHINGLDYFSRYDTFLETSIGQPLLTNTNACGAQNWQVNPILFSASTVNPTAPWSAVNVLNPNCPAPISPNTFPIYTQNHTDNCTTAIQYHSNSLTQKVYTPACYESASTCSHFEDECLTPSQNDTYFVMSNVGLLGVAKHYLQEEERAVLCDLGYLCCIIM